MRRATKWSWGLILVAGLTGLGQSAAAGLPESNLTIAIHIHDYAAVDQKTLTETEKVATGIFRQAGVQTRWIDAAPLSDQQQVSTDGRSVGLADITLNILPRTMADRLQLSSEAMGLAPGTGRDRQIVYVFYNRTDRANDTQQPKFGWIYVRTSQTLGHVIAHELGHLLLNVALHSQAGIMRGDWGLEDLREVACGQLFFTSQQAEVIRAEVARRVGQR
jgi:hypothetical protein